MNRYAVVIAANLLVAPAVYGAPQEETFTLPEPGSDTINGEKLSRLLERNDPKAMNNVGWLWARGEGGVKQNYKEAMQWFKHAARMGYAPAMNNVGLLYANGHGVPQSFEEAFKWWMRSAERGNAWGMNAVGDAYETGQGAPQNFELALTWYREAAREGDTLAMWNVGNLTRQGRGTAADAEAALQSFLQAAEGGYAPAMVDLGRMYQAGEAVKTDVVEAYAWHALAAQRLTAEHPEEAQQNSRALAQLEGQLTQAQREAGATRAAALADRYKKAEPKRPEGGGNQI